MINNKIIDIFVRTERINLSIVNLKLIFLSIIVSLSACNVAISQNADKPTTIKSAKKNVAKKKRKQEKARVKAEKKAKKKWLKLQTPATRKRIKKNEKMNKRRRNGRKYRIY